MYRDIPEGLRALIEPVIEDSGFELVDVVLNRGRRPWLLRVTIDRPEGDGPIPVDRCATVSPTRPIPSCGWVSRPMRRTVRSAKR